MGAWHAIRRNAETSQLRTTKEKAKEFGYDLPSNIGKLQRRLRKGYQFAPAFGATPSKSNGNGKRPLVVAPIEDRIVQRAILDVLQGAKDLPKLRAVLDTATSIGGIPGRGVDTAIKLIDEAWLEGYRFAAGSDIRGFFTRISKPQVIAFLSAEIDDQDFLPLLDRALKVELLNAKQLSTEDLLMFPTGPDGVAQGSPLSALAGNVVLNHFDREMNDPARGLICIRYIDDFIILGKKLKSVEKGMEAAKRQLQALRMDVYEADGSGHKAFVGRLDGTQDFLGYCLAPGRYPPSRSAQSKFRSAIDRLIRDGQSAIDKALSGRALKPSDRTFAATIVAITKTTQGWRGAFQCSHCPETFKELDQWVHSRVGDLQGYLRRRSHDKAAMLKGMALGVMPLVPPVID